MEAHRTLRQLSLLRARSECMYAALRPHYAWRRHARILRTTTTNPPATTVPGALARHQKLRRAAVPVKQKGAKDVDKRRVLRTEDLTQALLEVCEGLLGGMGKWGLLAWVVVACKGG